MNDGVLNFSNTPLVHPQATFITFDAPGGQNDLVPSGINPVGAITGTYVTGSYPFVFHGFLRAPDGTFTTIDFPGAFFTEVLAINPAGVIVGDFCNAVTCYQGFVRTPDGTFTVINADAGIPFGINPAGAITGSAADGSGGYLRSPNGTFITFNPPGEQLGTASLAINPAGAITGFYFEANFVAHGLPCGRPTAPSRRSIHRAPHTHSPPQSTRVASS